MPNVSVYIDERVWTYSDYVRLPESPYFYYEIIEGELKMVAKPIPNHKWVAGELFRILKEKVEDNNLGFVLQEVDVVAGEERVVAPDMVIVKKENSYIITDENIKGVPDMVVEVVSPSTRSYDLEEKKDFYEKIKIKEYWACDYLERRVYVFSLKDERFTHEIFDSIAPCRLFGFNVNVDEIFRNLPFPVKSSYKKS